MKGKNIFHIQNHHQHFNMYIGNNEHLKKSLEEKNTIPIKNNIIPIENYLKK